MSVSVCLLFSIFWFLTVCVGKCFFTVVHNFSFMTVCVRIFFIFFKNCCPQFLVPDRLFRTVCVRKRLFTVVQFLVPDRWCWQAFVYCCPVSGVKLGVSTVVDVYITKLCMFTFVQFLISDSGGQRVLGVVGVVGLTVVHF